MLHRPSSLLPVPRAAGRALACLVATLLALVLSGCGPRLVPFTHELRVQNNLSDEDLKNLQYYVSHRITLRREIESGGSQITSSHKLLLVSGKTIEEVVVEEHTPGVAVAIKGGTMAVSFETGASILFAASPEPGTPAPTLADFASPPDPFPGNNGAPREPEPFPGLGAGVGGTYWLAVGQDGRIPYQGKLFAAIEESLRAHLMIDADSLEEVVESSKVLPGVRLPER